MRIRFKKLDENAVMPKKAHDSDAGFDLTAVSMEFDNENGVIDYGTGIAVEIPKGYVGLLFSRSSIYKKQMALSNSVGVIDSGYRGEIRLKFRTTDKLYLIPERPALYEAGDRIGQLIIMPYPEIEFEEADELQGSDRNAKGFGSTGN